MEIPGQVLETLKEGQEIKRKTDKYVFVCEEHGEYIATMSNRLISHSNGKTGCPICGRKDRALKNKERLMSIKEVPKILIEHVVSIGEWHGNNTEVMLRCPICKKEYYTVLNRVVTIDGNIKGRLTCKSCSSSESARKQHSRRVFPQWFIDELVEESDKELARSSVLTSKDKCKFLCMIHGEYLQRVNERINITTGEKKSDCPKCGRIKKYYNMWDRWKFQGMRSRVEIEIDNFVQSLGYQTEHCPGILDGFEIDIYIKSLSKGIEVDGYGHYECETNEEYVSRIRSGQVVKRPGYHHNKDFIAESKGIKLIHIREEEWRNREEMEEKIKQFLS